MSRGLCNRQIPCRNRFISYGEPACGTLGLTCPDGLPIGLLPDLPTRATKASPADMAEAHWSYVNSVLVAHGVPDDHREVAKHHYIAAFIHGFKHGAAGRG